MCLLLLSLILFLVVRCVRSISLALAVNHVPHAGMAKAMVLQQFVHNVKNVLATVALDKFPLDFLEWWMVCVAVHDLREQDELLFRIQAKLKQTSPQ